MNGLKTAIIPKEVIGQTVDAWSSVVVFYSLGLKLGVEGLRRYGEKNLENQRGYENYS